jgi:hypothetical protein
MSATIHIQRDRGLFTIAEKDISSTIGSIQGAALATRQTAGTLTSALETLVPDVKKALWWGTWCLRILFVLLILWILGYLIYMAVALANTTSTNRNKRTQ